MVQTKRVNFAYRYTQLSTLVIEALYYRLLDALEDEALAYIENSASGTKWMRSTSIAEVERYASRNTTHRKPILITKVHT